MPMLIPAYSPSIRNYVRLAIKQLEDGWISNHGPCVASASSALSALSGVPYSILMNNGTAATECLLVALKYKYPRIKNIIIPDRTFIAPWSAAFRIFGLNSIYAIEVNPYTLNLAPSESQLNDIPPDSCLLVVHNVGSIVNVDEVHKIRPDIIILEDNCEGFLGKYNGILTGSSENTFASALSFYGNKSITCGEGGAFLTRDKDVYQYIKRYHSHGMGEERYVHPIAGSNFRMTNIAAALLHEQLLDANHILARLRQVYENYLNLFSSLSRIVRVIETDVNTEKSYWVFAISLACAGNYEEFEYFMLLNQIEVRPIFPSYSKHQFLESVPLIRHKENIPDKSSFGCLLPSGPGISEADQIHVVEAIKAYLSQ